MMFTVGDEVQYTVPVLVDVYNVTVGDEVQFTVLVLGDVYNVYCR